MTKYESGGVITMIKSFLFLVRRKDDLIMVITPPLSYFVTSIA